MEKLHFWRKNTDNRLFWSAILTDKLCQMTLFCKILLSILRSANAKTSVPKMRAKVLCRKNMGFV